MDYSDSKTLAGIRHILEAGPSLRDRFAMAALQGMLAADVGALTNKDVALCCYAYADDMLKVRDTTKCS